MLLLETMVRVLIINLVLYIIKYINFITSPVKKPLNIEQPLLNNNDYINNTIVDNTPTDNRVVPIENIYDDISNYNN